MSERMKKINIEEVKKIFEQAGLFLSNDNYKSIDTKMDCYDKAGYKFCRSLRSVKHQLKCNKTNVVHIFSNKNPYFYDNMLKYIESNIKNGTVLLTQKKDIKSVDDKLCFKCGECGKEYYTTWHNFCDVEEKCCSFCFNRKRKRGEVDSKRQDNFLFHKDAWNNGYVILDGPQIAYQDKVLVQDKEGYKGFVYASSILRGSSFDKFGTNNPYTIDNLRVYAFNHDWDCIIYNQEYKSDKHPLKMLCSCGEVFYVDCNHFLAGKFQCNKCRVKQSYISSQVEKWLIKSNIHYNKEKRFFDCVDKKPLPFDYYLTDFSACVEVDGIGHYRPVAFDGNKEKAKEVFNDRQQKDKIKTDYCMTHNIPLLRLPFWEIENGNYVNLLKDFILSVGNNASNE